VGRGREAMANDAHGVDVHRNCKVWLDKKGGEREVMWIFGESPPQ